MIPVHPLAELVPSMSAAEYADLKADIKANGQCEPITLYEGKILDGRHRARALDELNIEPDTRAYDGDEPAGFVLSLNLKRRSLTTSQRAAVAVEFLPVLQEEARVRQVESGRRHGRGMNRSASDDADLSHGRNRSSAKAGALAGVSGPSVERAARVKREAPEEFERVKNGEVTVSAAERKIRSNGKRKRLTFTSDNKHGRRVMAKAAQRLSNLVAGLDGYRMGLENFDVDRALLGAGAEDIKQWDEMLGESIKAFRELRSQIKKGAQR